MALSGLMWWIDRWRKSTAYMDMTLDEQGAYRNLLDEAFLRGGSLPKDERVLARACGDITSWERVRTRVMACFTLKGDGYHNKTLDDVIHQTKRRVKKQKAYRDRKGRGHEPGNARGNEHGNDAGNEPGNDSGHDPGHDAGNEPGYLDPDLRRELSRDQESSRRGRARAFNGRRLKVSERQHQVAEDESGARHAGVDLVALYPEWDADLVVSNEEFDTLAYIKRRALEAVAACRRPAIPLDANWFEECQQLHEGKCGGRLRHHNRMLTDAEKAKAVNA